MSTDERMEKMEGQLARVRWVNRCLIGCIVLGLGVWFISKTFTRETAWTQSGAKEIRANLFIVEDENGKPRITLAVGKDEPMVSLWDENGKRRAALVVDKEGPMLALLDENGKVRVELGISRGKLGFRYYDERARIRIMLGEDKLGFGLAVYDENGRLLPLTPETGWEAWRP